MSIIFIFIFLEWFCWSITEKRIYERRKVINDSRNSSRQI